MNSLNSNNFQKNPWLQGLHQHIGSQGILLEQLVLGVERLVEFAQKVNDQVSPRQKPTHMNVAYAS